MKFKRGGLITLNRSEHMTERVVYVYLLVRLGVKLHNSEDYDVFIMTETGQVVGPHRSSLFERIDV